MTIARIDTEEMENISTICHISSEKVLFNILILLHKLAYIITQELHLIIRDQIW